MAGQKKTSDYINANYIDGFQKANAYIGTQVNFSSGLQNLLKTFQDEADNIPLILKIALKFFWTFFVNLD